MTLWEQVAGAAETRSLMYTSDMEQDGSAVPTSKQHLLLSGAAERWSDARGFPLFALVLMRHASMVSCLLGSPGLLLVCFCFIFFAYHKPGKSQGGYIRMQQAVGHESETRGAVWASLGFAT